MFVEGGERWRDEEGIRGCSEDLKGVMEGVDVF